jgi:hypothetical protein
MATSTTEGAQLWTELSKSKYVVTIGWKSSQFGGNQLRPGELGTEPVGKNSEVNARSNIGANAKIYLENSYFQSAFRWMGSPGATANQANYVDKATAKFGHELRHALDILRGSQASGTTSNGLDWAEEQAMDSENLIRRELGLPHASTYNGIPLVGWSKPSAPTPRIPRIPVSVPAPSP